MTAAHSAKALDPQIDITALVSDAVQAVKDPAWRLELAAHGAMHGVGTPGNRVPSAVKQAFASLAALGMLAWVVARHGGSNPRAARTALAAGGQLFALHGEDSTRTRHLRNAIASNAPSAPMILLLGRPRGSIAEAVRALDPQGLLAGARYLRPLSGGSLIAAIPQALRALLRGLGATARYRGTLPFAARTAIAYRMAQGAVHAAWWRAAAAGAKRGTALFGHTGTGDTSLLELAMQASGWRSVHLVHGTNIGWSFAGLSDCAIFPSAADARLGASLPAYGRCLHLPIARPEVSKGNGDWALLTSYSHLHHPAYRAQGSLHDRLAIELLRDAARALGQDPSRILWRPHPQIALIDPDERSALERAAADAGFTPWPGDLAYESLGAFSAVVTTPSTVLTDALRRGQPAIVLSLAPLQRDLLYGQNSLFAGDGAELLECLRAVHDPARRKRAFVEAWEAIGPGAAISLDALLHALDDRGYQHFGI